MKPNEHRVCRASGGCQTSDGDFSVFKGDSVVRNIVLVDCSVYKMEVSREA